MALLVFVLIMGVIVFTGYINEKALKLQPEIIMLIVSFVIGILYIGVQYIINPGHVPSGFPVEYLNEYLVNGVLCFMLFAGSSEITFRKLRKNGKIISLLALVTTTITTFLFGFLFYFVLGLFGITTFSLLECLLLGAIVSPTDPIAATGILKNVGLSDDLILIIEGESLFNDGVGIALFIAISSAVTSSAQKISAGSFFFTLGKEIIGAAIVSLIICYVMLNFFKRTNDACRRIFISLFALSASYVACQYLGFSSAIAAVICGIYFATFVNDTADKAKFDFTLYKSFWEVVDSLLNQVLYVILGIFFVNIFIYTENNVLYIITAIAAGIAARFVGVFLVSLTSKQLPEKLTCGKFSSLLTWAGLKGGLSLALMVEAFDLLTEEKFHIMIILVFAIVMFTTALQGLTVEKYYKKIKNK